MYLNNNIIIISKYNSYNKNLILLYAEILITIQGFDNSIAYK